MRNKFLIKRDSSQLDDLSNINLTNYDGTIYFNDNTNKVNICVQDQSMFQRNIDSEHIYDDIDIEIPSINPTPVIEENTIYVTYSVDNIPTVVYKDNLSEYLTVTIQDNNVSISQSNVNENTTDELTYILTGKNLNGSFYLEGEYKTTVILNNLYLENQNGSPLKIKNSKRIDLKITDETINTLIDHLGNDKGCFTCNGHVEIKGHGVLNIIGNHAHALHVGEYLTIKNATINIENSITDGINCNEYFLMTSGILNMRNIGDDCIQVSLEGNSNTGQTIEHQDEDSANIYIDGGTLNLSNSNSDKKGLKSEGDIIINGGNVNIHMSGSGIYDTSKGKLKSCSCINADGSVIINNGNIVLTGSGAGNKCISGDTKVEINNGDITCNVLGGALVYYNDTVYEGSFNTELNKAIFNSLTSSTKILSSGLKSKSNVVILGGNINIFATGANSVGIDSINAQIDGNSLCNFITYDNCFNSSTTIENGEHTFISINKNVFNNITINNGKIFAMSLNNNAIKSESTFTYQSGSFLMNGTAINSSIYTALKFNENIAKGQTIIVYDESDNELIRFVLPIKYKLFYDTNNTITSVIKHPDFVFGASYKLKYGTTEKYYDVG